MANKSNDNNGHGETIGIAVGLGVGIPILVTVAVLMWVTVRHNRKLREEDDEHKDIDFDGGDVSFFSPGRKQSDFEVNTQSNVDDADSTFFSETDARPPPHISNMIYTPEIGAQHSQETFSRRLNSVYGPSPAYPSTEKLRAPTNGSAASIRTFGSMYLPDPGPFATPPRRGSHPYSPYVEDRRQSVASVPSVPFIRRDDSTGVAMSSAGAPFQPSHNPGMPSIASTIGPPLGQLNEAPHPYQDLIAHDPNRDTLRETSTEDVFTEAPEAPGVPEVPAEDARGDCECNEPPDAAALPPQTRASYRKSTFDFES